jgi:3-dehydroquinate synthase
VTELAELTLRHPQGETTILVGAGALAAAEERLAAWLDGRTVFLVTTPRIAALHGARLGWLDRHCARRVTLEVPDGEAAKTLDEAGRLWREMLAAGGKRDSRVIALGGGSVSDLAGFAAGCFLRGVEVVHAPTTLLAQADAAIGGKTGVDLPAGKNTVGLFHHPAAVIADTEVLRTLPRRELAAGLVEVVKMALVLDPALFARLEDRLEALLDADAAELAPVVAATAAAKAAAVEHDPAEGDYRRVLNLGHTLGHALESALGYGGLLHGEAVAYGMLFALRLAVRRGLDPATAERVRALLARLGPAPLPAADPRLAPPGLIGFVQRDKKAREGGIDWVLPTALGGFEITREIGLDAVAAELEGFLADPWRAIGPPA